MPKGCLIFQMQPNHINNRYHSKHKKNTLALAYSEKIHPNLICLDLLNLAIHLKTSNTGVCKLAKANTEAKLCKVKSTHKVPGLVVLAFFPSCERVLPQETWSSSIIHSNTGPLQHSPLALLKTSGLCSLSGTLDSQHYRYTIIYKDCNFF